MVKGGLASRSELKTTATPTIRNNNNNNNNDQTTIQLALLSQIQQQLVTLTEQVVASNNEIRNLRKELNSELNNVNKNINRVYYQQLLVAPPVPQRPDNQQTTPTTTVPDLPEEDEEEKAAIAKREIVQVPLPGSVTLSNSPRTLYDLWLEYTTGLGGNKPARDYTSYERGMVRFKYSRRKVFWDCVTKHICVGFTAMMAIERIRNCYGKSLSVTSILNLMVKDRNKGGHEDLRL